MSLLDITAFRLAVALACALVTASATSQSPLTTTFAGGNQGATNGTVYCDLTPAGPGVTISQIGTHLQATGAVGRVDVYVMQGASATTGYGNPAAWTLHSQCAVIAGALGSPSVLVLDPPLSIAGGTTCGMALAGFDVGHRYTNSTGTPPQVWTNSDLTLTSRGVSNLPFGSGLSTQTTRIVNLAIHYAPSATATVATAAQLGASCGPKSFASLYEWFGYYNGASQFDLANTNMTFSPTGGGYQVVAGGNFNPVGSLSTPTALTLSGDGVATPGSLGLNVAANGFVALGPGNSGSAASSILPNPTAVMNNPSTAWYVYHDWDPTLGGNVQYEESGMQAQITFNGVFNASYTGVQGPSYFQFQINLGSGIVVVAIGSVTVDTAPYLVGYSPGGPSKNPGSTNLSSALSGTIVLGAVDLLQPVLHASTRPVMGASWNVRCEEIPPTTGFGLTIYGVSDPGILDLFFIGMPSCQLRSTLDIIDGPWFPTGSTYNYSLPVPGSPPSLIGFSLFTQVATFDMFPVNAFGAITTNGLRGVLDTL